MTTVRRWGVQFRHDAWMRHGDIPSDRLGCARLFDSPQEAAAVAVFGTVREVLVTHEAGGIELVRWVNNASNADGAFVVAYYCNGSSDAPDGFLSIDRQIRPRASAAVFTSSAIAWDEAARFMVLRDGADRSGECLVWSVRRTEPREVRLAGRTLDEILASVPVEVPSDD